jgi:hypothetical protein
MSDKQVPNPKGIREDIARVRDAAAWLRRRLTLSAVRLAELDAMTSDRSLPVPSQEHIDDFVAWLRDLPRGWKVSDVSRVQATDRALTSFVADRGAPKGGCIRAAEAGKNDRDALWWEGFGVQDYGAYRLIYDGD